MKTTNFFIATLTFAVMLLPFHATAERNYEGSLMIGGELGMFSDTETREVEDADENIQTVEERTGEFRLSPSIGYYLTNEFAVGLGFTITSGSETTSGMLDIGLPEIENSTFRWSVGPFARYYFYQNQWFRFYGQGTLSLGSGSFENRTTNPVTNETTVNDGALPFNLGLNARPGLSFQLTERFAIETNFNLGLFYNMQTHTTVDNDDNETTNTSHDFNFTNRDNLDITNFNIAVRFYM